MADVVLDNILPGAVHDFGWRGRFIATEATSGYLRYSDQRFGAVGDRVWRVAGVWEHTLRYRLWCLLTGWEPDGRLASSDGVAFICVHNPRRSRHRTRKPPSPRASER